VLDAGEGDGAMDILIEPHQHAVGCTCLRTSFQEPRC
jgi:hypothetical protein